VSCDQFQSNGKEKDTESAKDDMTSLIRPDGIELCDNLRQQTVRKGRGGSIEPDQFRQLIASAKIE
jgi:hypothetical protein